MQLQDQTILITGAAGRIGSAVARELHSKNASLVLCDVNKLTLDELCLLYTSPSPRDMRRSRMPSSA